jgi:hypothetical protein
MCIDAIVCWVYCGSSRHIHKPPSAPAVMELWILWQPMRCFDLTQQFVAVHRLPPPLKAGYEREVKYMNVEALRDYFCREVSRLLFGGFRAHVEEAEHELKAPTNF